MQEGWLSELLVKSMYKKLVNLLYIKPHQCPCRGHPRGRFGRKSLPKLADFSLSWAEGEVKMYRMYREIQNLDQNFSPKSWNRRKTSPLLKAEEWPLPMRSVSMLTDWLNMTLTVDWAIKQKKSEAVLISTHNLCFGAKITKVTKVSLNCHLVWAVPSKNVPSGHGWTTKAQIRLHGYTVWSGPVSCQNHWII